MRWAGRLVVVAVLLISLAGCGGGNKQTTTTATTPRPATTTIRVYFLRDGKVQPVVRTVPSPTDFPIVALAELTKGPTRSERQDLGLSTSTSSPYTFSLSDGVVKDHGTFTRPELAQIVYTITRYSAKVAAVNGRRYTRADFEDETPAILVESPLPFQKVTSPLRATGTANTFEATFQYDLVDPAGKLLKTHFVTATSGTGTRGTFDFTVPFTVDRGGMGKLVVYELSAKDGSRIHEVEIPVRLTP